MSKMIVYFLLLFCHVHVCLTTTNHHRLIHPCSVERYTETLYRPKCSTKPVSIVSTRCRGQCPSEDYLLYDWQSTSTYRHQHTIHCCSPNRTQIYQQIIQCDNKQLETVRYRLISQCECKSCSDRCLR